MSLCEGKVRCQYWFAESLESGGGLRKRHSLKSVVTYGPGEDVTFS